MVYKCVGSKTAQFGRFRALCRSQTPLKVLVFDSQNVHIYTGTADFLHVCVQTRSLAALEQLRPLLKGGSVVL